MIAHQITLEWSDGAAELLALDFTTGRVIVRWGDEVTACVTAYRLDQTDTWRREDVPYGYRVDALAGAAGDSRCRDLGPMRDETITVRPLFDELACASSWLRERVQACSHVRERARGIARWLLGMRATLATSNGLELFDALARRDALGGVDVDDILGELVRLQVIYPHAHMPRGDAILVGCDAANLPACFRGRFALDADPANWGRACAGAKHWLYQCGPAWEACTGVRAGYRGK